MPSELENAILGEFTLNTSLKFIYMMYSLCTMSALFVMHTTVGYRVHD